MKRLLIVPAVIWLGYTANLMSRGGLTKRSALIWGVFTGVLFVLVLIYGR